MKPSPNQIYITIVQYFLEYSAMHILLININPVVSRLISLCMREDHIDFEEVQNIGAVSRDKYDVVFVDEASYDDETEEVLANLIMRKKVFLSSNDEAGNEKRLFGTVIKKPFLPSQITAVLESLEEDTSEATTEIPSIFPLPGDEVNSENVKENENETEEEGETADTKVLDLYEIDKIKALLDMDEEIVEVSEEEYESRKIEVIKQQLISDGLEIVDENEYVEALSKKPLSEKNEKSSEQSDNPAGKRTKKIKARRKEDKTKKIKKNKKEQKVKKKKEDSFTFEEALIAAVEGMKVKKIKKLLKNAEVTIKINFKDKK